MPSSSQSQRRESLAFWQGTTRGIGGQSRFAGCLLVPAANGLLQPYDLDFHCVWILCAVPFCDRLQIRKRESNNPRQVTPCRIYSKDVMS